MNTRELSLTTRATEGLRKVARTTRHRRNLAIDSLQLLEGRQLMAAFSVSYSATVPVQTTDYSIPTSLPKFDPTLGTLNSVDLTFSTSGSQQGTLTNVASGPETFTFQETVNVSLTDNSNTTLLSPNLTASQTYVFVAPNTPTAFGPYSPSSSTSSEYTSGPIFNEFDSGPGNLPLNVTTLTSTVTTGGGGNIRSILTTTAGATATVTSNYTATPVTLSGNVYEDQQGTGALAPGDPPIPGTTIELLSSTGSTIATTTTASNGAYSFTTTAAGTPILPGNYTIEEIQPTGYLQGTNTVGTVNGVTTGILSGVDRISSIVLTSGQNSIGNNFGELLPVSLSGNVYDDLKNSGSIAPGDLPIGGVLLSLVDASGTTVATTLTNNLGAYYFTTTSSGAPLTPQTYTINETQPIPYLQGSNTVGTVNGVPTGSLTGLDQIGDIILKSGQSSFGNNFGEVLPVTLSGTVYEDVNRTGSITPGDLPIPGTVVTLFTPGGPVATTTTNAFGVYSFTTGINGAPLRPDTYTIVETQPAGFVQGTNSIGTVNGVPDGTMPVQDIFTSIGLNSGQSGFNYNFGEIRVAPSPVVTTVDRFGVHNQPTIIYLAFSTPLDPTSAQNVANYQILGPTDSKGPALVPIESAHYDPATRSVTLKLGERLQVHHPYTLTVTGLTSTTGSPLVGSNGMVGSPYVTTLNRAVLAGFTDIYGTFIPINHGQLYPAAATAGYKLKRFNPPAKLGPFAPANQAAYQVATSPSGEIAPIALKGRKPLPPAIGLKTPARPPLPLPVAIKKVKHHATA